jgi:hypothetical protein
VLSWHPRNGRRRGRGWVQLPGRVGLRSLLQAQVQRVALSTSRARSRAAELGVVAMLKMSAGTAALVVDPIQQTATWSVGPGRTAAGMERSTAQRRVWILVAGMVNTPALVARAHARFPARRCSEGASHAALGAGWSAGSMWVAVHSPAALLRPPRHPRSCVHARR